MRRILPTILAAIFVLAGIFPAHAVTITTTYTNNNGFAAVTFNFANNNTYPVIISEIGSVCGTSATTTAELWYNTTAVNTTTQPTISAANGWQLAGSGTVTGIANTTTTTAQMLINNLTLTIPANTTYGLCLNISNYPTGSLRYSSLTAGGPYLTSAGGCDLVTGTNISWAGAQVPGPLANNNRGFIGYVTFAPGITTPPGCVAAPLSPANNATTVCSGTTVLRWNKVPTASAYDVYLNTGTGNPTTVVSANQADTFYNATTTVGPYVWQIIPKNSIGAATGCNTFTFTTIQGVTPMASITVMPKDTVCIGDSAVFKVTITNGGTAPSYQWKKNNQNVGTNSPTYTDNNIINNDNYKVILTSNSTACLTANGITSNTITMKVLPSPVVAVTPAGPTAFCSGGSVTLNAATGGTSYQWLNSNTAIAGATANSYVAMYNGYYKVKVTGIGNGCPAISDSVRVTVYRTPFPRINRNGNILTTEANYATYQWYRGNNAIGGATTSSYTVTNDGLYSVKVTDSAGCSGSSVYAPVNNLAVGSLQAADVKIYPNPAASMVFIESAAPVTTVVSSPDGRTILYKAEARQLDISGLANGIYTLTILDKERRVVRTDKLTKLSN